MSFKDVVNRALRAGLGEEARPRQPAAPKTLPHAFAFRPGIDLDKLNRLADYRGDFGATLRAYAAHAIGAPKGQHIEVKGTENLKPNP